MNDIVVQLQQEAQNVWLLAQTIWKIALGTGLIAVPFALWAIARLQAKARSMGRDL